MTAAFGEFNGNQGFDAELISGLDVLIAENLAFLEYRGVFDLEREEPSRNRTEDPGPAAGGSLRSILPRKSESERFTRGA